MAFNIEDEATVEREARLLRDDDARRDRVMRIIERCAANGSADIPDHGEFLYDSETGLPR